MGTREFIVAESEARTGLILATFIADITVTVINEGQFTQGLGNVNGAVFTVAVVKGVGSGDFTVEESVDGLVEGPSTADNVFSTILTVIDCRFVINDNRTHVQTIGTDKDGVNTEGLGKGQDLVTGVGTEDVVDGEALSDLGEVGTSTEGGLISQFADTSTARIALSRAG